MTLLTMIHKFYPEVTQVKDATRNLFVTVDRKDINSTAVKKHGECAIAVACRRHAHFDGAIVGISKAYLIKGNVAYRFDVTKAAQREIISFDRSGIFDPGEYQLSRPTTKLGSHSSAGPRNTGVKSKRYRHVTENIRGSLRNQ